MALEPLAIEKIDFGPCAVNFGNSYLGRTKGETTFNYSLETYDPETEEDGQIDSIITKDPLIVTVPLLYTDVDTLSTVIPWAIKDAGTGKLFVGNAVGKRLTQFAGSLTITPVNGGNKLNIYKAYPKPGPLNFAYARTGERIANVQFVAIKDETKPAGKEYFDIEPATPQCDPVYASPDSGQYDTAQSVELSCATTGASIYYTVDGSTPDETDTLYNEAIAVDAAQVIKAVAIKADFENSDVAEFYYVGTLTP